MKKSNESFWSDHFSVLRDKQTYMNLAYLLLAFPLGIAYFVIMITGLSLGVGLLIVWIGLFVLAALFAGLWGIAALERQLAIHLLGEEIAPMSPPEIPEGGLWERVKAHFSNPVTWKSSLYLLLKFPVGIATFVVVVTALAISGGLLFAPFSYHSNDMTIFFWHIDTFFEAVFATGLGVIVTPIAFRFLNQVARLSGRFANTMLGSAEYPEEKSPEDILNLA